MPWSDLLPTQFSPPYTEICKGKHIRSHISRNILFCSYSILPYNFRPKDYRKVLTQTYIIVATYYFLVAVLGYMIWGNNVGKSITLNVSEGTVI